MLLDNPSVIGRIAGFGAFLWVGLYLLVRAPRRTPLIVASLLGLLSQAAYFGSGALSDTTTDRALFVALQQGFWWTTVLPAAAWFHVSGLIVQRLARSPTKRGRLLSLPALVVYLAALGMIAAGTIGDLIVAHSRPLEQDGTLVVAPGPAYPFYIAYLGAVIAGACVNLLRALRKVARGSEPTERALAQQLRLLLGGGLFFLTGGLWIASRTYWHLPISPLPGYLCVLVGLAALGYGVAHFGLLLEGQNIQRDFFYSFTGILVMNALYVGLLAAAGQLSAGSLLALVGLVTLTHTAFDSGRAALDRLFFNRAEQAARAEARDYATVLAAQPVGTSELPDEDAPNPAPGEPTAAAADEAAPGDAADKRFKDAVRKALTGLRSPPRLAQSPLLALALVERRVAQSAQEDNRLNRVAALRELLIEQIESLRPPGSAPQVGDSWRFYNVLFYPYVRELSRKGALAEARRLGEERRRAGLREPGELEQVLSWLADVDEDTFYKWQRRASDLIALALWEENAKL
jgi:hypothetical protein